MHDVRTSMNSCQHKKKKKILIVIFKSFHARQGGNTTKTPVVTEGEREWLYFL